MGNCCEHPRSLTDNDVENLIRETIQTTKIYRMSLRDVEEVFVREIQVPLLDIEGDFRKWINKDLYEDLTTQNFLDNRYDDELANQKLLLLDYRDNYEGMSFKYIYAMWLLAFVNDDSISTKADLAHTIISKSERVSTFQTFRNFIYRYLDVVLYRVTWNFMQSPNVSESILKVQFDELVNNIYTKENIDNYAKALCHRFVKFIGKEGSEERSLATEFILPVTLRQFFHKNYYLLDVVRLREDFYDCYCKRRINKFN
jgi:hypothetical protein